MRRLALLALIATLGCAAFAEPENIEVSIDAPVSVSVGQAFEVVLTVKNTGPSNQTLVDMDIGEDYLEGVVVQKMDPPFKDALDAFGIMTYSMDLALPPEQEITVTISAYAAHAGDYSGSIDLCINSAVSCLYYPVRTIIR